VFPRLEWSVRVHNWMGPQTERIPSRVQFIRHRFRFVKACASRSLAFTHVFVFGRLLFRRSGRAYDIPNLLFVGID
jgi:hypothetical protein